LINRLIFQNRWKNEEGEEIFHFHLKICKDFASGEEQTFGSVIVNMYTNATYMDMNQYDLYAIGANRERLIKEAFALANTIRML